MTNHELEERYHRLKIYFWTTFVALWMMYLDCNLDLGLAGILRFW